MKSLRQAIKKSWVLDLQIVRVDAASLLGLSRRLSQAKKKNRRFFQSPWHDAFYAVLCLRPGPGSSAIGEGSAT
jgi:hypothetical protein